MDTIELEPGIYYDIPWADYCEIPYLTQSILKNGLRSMKRLKRVKDGLHRLPKPETVAIGNAVHCMIAGEFSDRCAVLPDFEQDDDNVTATGNRSTSKSTKYYKESKADFEAEHADKSILKPAQFEAAEKTVKAIQNNPDATTCMAGCFHEVTVVAELEGVMCKTRIDLLNLNDGPRVAELKTTDDIAPHKFYRKCKQLNYFFQFAFHRLLLENAGDDWTSIQQYDVIAAEVQDDFDVGVIQILPFSIIDDWCERVTELVVRYRGCKERDIWPGLYAGPAVIAVPEYDMSTATFEG